MMLQAFSKVGDTLAISASTTTSSGTLRSVPVRDNRVVRVVNPTSGSVAFFTQGGTATATNGSPVLPGSERLFTLAASTTTVAVILNTGTGTIYVEEGVGN